MHGELAALEPEPQLVLEPEQLAELARHVEAEDLVAAAAGLLGGVHGDVGLADQLLAGAGTAGVDDDADARAERQLVAGDRRRLGEALEQAPRDGDRLLLVGALQQERELVAAQARERVATGG